MNRLTVQLFAALKDVVGSATIEFDFDAEFTIDQTSLLDLKSKLTGQFPESTSLIAQSRFAVDQSYQPDAFVVSSLNSEVALIPPVSGG